MGAENGVIGSDACFNIDHITGPQVFQQDKRCNAPVIDAPFQLALALYDFHLIEGGKVGELAITENGSPKKERIKSI